MRFVLLAVAIVLAGPAPAPAADHAPPPATRTGKERLGTKGSDEQRVNDCKVPPAERTRARPGC